MAESQFLWHRSADPARMRAALKLEIVENRLARESVTLSESPECVKRSKLAAYKLIRGALVIQIRAQPALNGPQFQALASLIIEHLIAADPAHGKVTRLGMREI